MKMLAGFSGQVFLDKYADNKGKPLRIVASNITSLFSKTYVYPDGTKTLAGADYSAMKYMARAMNFRPV